MSDQFSTNETSQTQGSGVKKSGVGKVVAFGLVGLVGVLGVYLGVNALLDTDEGGVGSSDEFSATESRNHESAAIGDARQLAIGLEALWTDANKYPDNLDEVRSAMDDFGGVLTDGNDLSKYTVDQEGGTFELCVVHADSGAWALYVSPGDIKAGTSGATCA